MKGEYIRARFKLESYDYIRVKNQLSAIFSGGDSAKRFKARQINFEPLEGSSDVNIGIYAVPTDFKTISLCYTVPFFAMFRTQQIDITRSQAMRLICTDASVTDELPGVFPADINAYMHTQSMIPGYFEEFSRVEYKNYAGDIRVTYDSDFGTCRDVRGFFSKVELVPKYLGMGIMTIDYENQPMGIQKEILDEIINCGYPL